MLQEYNQSRKFSKPLLGFNYCWNLITGTQKGIEEQRMLKEEANSWSGVWVVNALAFHFADKQSGDKF